MAVQKWLVIDWNDPGVFKLLNNKNEITEEMLTGIDERDLDILEITAPERPMGPGELGALTIGQVFVTQVDDEVEEGEEETAHLEYGGSKVLNG